MAMDMKKPVSTTGKLVTKIVGSANRRRKRLEFHAFTQSCSSSHWDSASVAEMPCTGMTGMPSMEALSTAPSAVE